MLALGRLGAECEPVRDANREFVRLFAPNPLWAFGAACLIQKTPSVISACTLCRARYATFDRIPHLTVKIQLTFALSASNTPGTQPLAYACNFKVPQNLVNFLSHLHNPRILRREPGAYTLTRWVSSVQAMQRRSSIHLRDACLPII